jgi:prepilin peptidase CpaA
MSPEALFAAAELFLKAAAIVMLVRIAVTDFRLQKIYNSELLSLLALALVIMLTDWVRSQEALSALWTGIASGALFLVLLFFWLRGKVGAGDVKLMSVVPLLVGHAAALPMAMALLAFVVLTYLVMKYPLVLPESWLRTYISALSKTGRVPFGVPIAAATIFALLLPAVT